MKSFDLIHTPIKGTNLIDASAGTGKTYTLAGLYIRLLLEEHIPVDRILVVTFTIAATDELRDRIRKTLLQVKSGLTRGSVDDPFTMELIARQTDRVEVLQRIEDAIIDFDRAAIFTIHGFCQRILHDNAFETGSLFDTELSVDPSDLKQEVIHDFWRKYFYSAPMEFVGYANKKAKISDPGPFHDLLNRIQGTDIRIVPELPISPIKGLKAYRSCFARLVSMWKNEREAVSQLLRHAPLKANIYGPLRIDGMIQSMDRFTGPHSNGFPPFKGFERFSTEKLSASIKKGNAPPHHDLFLVCDELSSKGSALAEEFDKRILALKARFVAFTETTLKKRKEENNTIFFDDLLLSVHQALDAEDGDRLAASIRTQYGAALVDEFQDTDSIQYRIFRRLFSSNDHTLFMIGDPKQAIYGFRGADVYSYLKAADRAAQRYTLSRNWRSDTKLIQAVNTLFSGTNCPFVIDDIPYEETMPGNPTSQSWESGPPFILWFLPSEDNRPISKEDATHIISEQVAGEILHLLGSKSESFSAGEIAILVRTNRQAQIIKGYLSKNEIPSVLFQSGNVFESLESHDLTLLLESIAEPAHVSKFKAALSSDLMGYSGESIQRAESNGEEWEGLRSNFRDYHELWLSLGFVRMFRTVMLREQIKERLLSLPDGERRLTNLLHLEELIHQTVEERKLGVSGILKWFSEQRENNFTGAEEHQLRLESDDDAVKIVTIHKSKGLEYPVVFCPFSWEGSREKKTAVLFHNPEENNRLTLDLGSSRFDHHAVIAQEELLAENLRLLYVAVTRAKNRCYVVDGHIRSADTSALAYLLHFQRHHPSENILDDLEKDYRAHTNETLLNDLNNLAGLTNNCIAVEEMPVIDIREPGNHTGGPSEPDSLVYKRFAGAVDVSWRISSYSSLISRRVEDNELPDRDAGIRWDEPTIEPGKEFTAFTFPKGTRTGLFFHELLEHLDFKDTPSETCTPIIDDRLTAYGLDRVWLDTVRWMIRQVVSIPLPADGYEFTLSDISLDHRINEMEFYYPLLPFSPADLQHVFATHAGIHLPDGFPDRLERLVFSPTSGFMKGFVDLVFFHNGQFFIIDWKSNYLGSRIEDYGIVGLGVAMRDDYYILQYHLYVLALDLYLSRRLPDYSYSRDFGGVFYLFIRGIDKKRGPAYGLFSDRPESDMVEALKTMLIPGSTAPVRMNEMHDESQE